MGLVGAREGLVDGSAGRLRLFFFSEGLRQRIELLDAGVEVEVERGRNAELRQRVLDGGLHEGVEDAFIIKLDFLLGGMNVDIHMGGVQVDEENVKREAVRRDHFRECVHDGVVEVAGFDEPVVNEEELVAPCLLGRFRFPHEPVDIHVIGAFLNGNEFGIIVLAEDGNDPLLE